MTRDLVELVLCDLLAEVCPLFRPLRPFDHPAIHVRDVDRAVRPGRHVGWTEQRIEGSNELGTRIHVLKLCQAIGLDWPEPADDPGHDFTMKVVTNEVLRKA